MRLKKFISVQDPLNTKLDWVQFLKQQQMHAE